jgi:uncharacterized small protein (DUF1192 family)
MENRGKWNRHKDVPMERLVYLKNKLEVELLSVGVSDTRIAELDNIDEEIERRESERHQRKKN